MLDVIKKIILEFHESRPETGVPRHLSAPTMSGKATVFIGVSRSGKSTFLFQIIKKLLDDGISRDNILYLNLLDDRIRKMRPDDIGLIAEAYYSLFPLKKNAEKIYCFFDEIQAISGWEAFINRILRTDKCDVYLAGSSADMLSKKIATQMRGRSLAWEIFPFSFREFLDYQGIEYGHGLSTQKSLLIQNSFMEYWETGGFPEVVGTNKDLRTKTLQEYYHTILYRDLIDRHNISHPKALDDLATWLMNNPASLYSINNLTAYLKSMTHKIPKSVVSDYLQWFEDSYFFFNVYIFDPSFNRRNANPKKIYCIDNAMIMSVSSGILTNSGHLLENIIFISLRRLYQNIFYYKTKTGKEVDFLVIRPDKTRMLIHVSQSLLSTETRKRETLAMMDAMNELGLSKGIIITQKEKERIDVPGGSIEVVPAWLFLLNLTESSQ
jgi:predicted AAA+ superfamily ATPase